MAPTARCKGSSVGEARAMGRFPAATTRKSATTGTRPSRAWHAKRTAANGAAREKVELFMRRASALAESARGRIKADEKAGMSMSNQQGTHIDE